MTYISTESGTQGRLLRRLLTSVSAVVVFGGVAQAQTATPPPVTNAQQPTAPADQGPAPADQGQTNTGPVRITADDIVVTGYRRSIETSLARKRAANAFIDVITAEDVGKFPDKNVADSLQRVPGVIIDRDGGEGSRVSIRGLQSDLTLTELNGNFIAGADTGDPSRSFNYLLLPSNMIGSIDVYKSPEARLDEGGVGGTIILHTRRPLDLKPWSGFVSAEGTISDVTNKVEPQISGQLSWHNASGTLGLLVGGTYQKRTNREMDGSTESWQWWTDGGRDGIKATDVRGRPIANDAAVSYWSQGRGETTQSGTHYNGYWAPQSVDESIVVSERERIGAQATLEWKPTDNLRLTANYFRFQLNSKTQSNVLKIPEWGYDNFFTAAKFDKSGTILQSATFQVPNAGTGCLRQTPICTMETPQLSGVYAREKDISNTFDLHGDWSHDRLSVSFIVGKTRSTGGPSEQFSVAAKPRLTGTVTQNGNFLSMYDYSGGGLNMTFSPELQQNLTNGVAQIDTGSTGSGFTNSSVEQRYAQVDVTRKFDGLLQSIQVGGKWRDGKITRETGELDWYADPATQLRFQDTPAGAVAQPSFFYSSPISNIPGGFTASSYPGINLTNYLSYLNKTYGQAVNVPQPQNLYKIDEKIWAGYIEANFKAGPVRGNIGLRVANTKQSGTSTDTIYREIDYCQDGPGGPFSPPPLGADGNCQVLPQSQREVREFSPNNESKSYTDILPSLNVSWDVTSNVLLRGAVSKVVARPAYNDLAAARSLTFHSAAYTYDRNQFGETAGWFGNGGNFNLKPFSAWAYDLGAEWYFHRGSVVGAALFRKDVKNFVVPLVLDLAQTVQGQQVLVQQYSTQANGASAVSEGVELYAQHTLDFGLGAQVNFTYNHTSTADVSLNGTKIGTSPLVGSAKTQWNASLFYEKHGVLLRASYNRKGEQVGGIVSGLNVYSDPYEQVDLNAQYNITDHISLTASVINLTKSEQRAHLGNDTTARYYSSQYTGRRFYSGVQWTF
ncbi:TonB-dependent receptor [Sphingomonas sp. TREG-RG-20F-R18-01]|uniref:TonB-dependent receptor n=1 Tax=Sphingomonas sp. TREG-RG-20F-R18-01 TaxID=2914982 RepID=UPI001F582F12|nr:TonB-dependent receptor [Sphingomonas sp. TREG-RG-20F-R18-01]